MRILDKQAGRLNIKHLGLVADDFALLQRLIARPHGILLVTGPTGSGKTTSLYAALTELNDQTRNILTAEDPIEYQIEGIGQTQVNSKVDLTFARSLRAMLRQDPDVVMVGEIRDLETAEIAVQASLTGHLVLSTLHTNTALGAIMRLQDMGIESFLIANALIGVIAQRLVRTLCSHCTQWTEAPASSLPYFADLLASPLLPAETQSKLANLTPTGGSVLLPKAMGCERCNNQGYVGRSAIYEIVPITEPLRRSIHNKADELDLESIARQSTRSIQHDGLIKVLHGKTTLEEVLRATIER
jgi:general secretion pathway protein E